MLLEGGWERARGKGGEIRWEVHNTWHMGKKCRVGAARGIPFENDYMTLLLPPAALPSNPSAAAALGRFPADTCAGSQSGSALALSD